MPLQATIPKATHDESCSPTLTSRSDLPLIIAYGGRLMGSSKAWEKRFKRFNLSRNKSPVRNLYGRKLLLPASQLGAP